jgi:AraC-like DNA-binding protein
MTLEQLTRTLLDEVGLAARPFVRWLRLRRYAGLVSAGATVDEAARASGYRRRSELTHDLRRLVGFTERDVDACQHWKPLPEVSATAA